jgi:hypothetical protein
LLLAFVLAVAFTTNNSHAQSTANTDWSSASDLQVMLQAIESVPPAPADSLSRGGTFWSAQHAPGAPLAWPPLPGNFNQVPVWGLGDGCYLLDDLDLDYEALSMQAMDAPYPDWGGGTNSYGGLYFGVQRQEFTTNDLWLEIISETNGTAHLVIHPPWNVTDGVWGLYFATNLALPFTNWTWLMNNEPGQTNLTATNLPTAQGFFRLGPVNDLLAVSSLGTNFWLAFCNLDYGGLGDLSLYISSPVGATGTVIAPGVIGNGPTVTVTKCGDVLLNGTYILTNLTAQERADWLYNGYNIDGENYARGTNWISYQNTLWNILAYDANSRSFTVLYYKSGINLNGNTNEWANDNDTNSPPATLCMQVAFTNSFTVAAGTVTNIILPEFAMQVDNDEVETNGIQVIASAPVSVYGVGYYSTISAAFTGYPTSLLGTNYCVLARPTLTPYVNAYSELTIVATTNYTTVTITPSPTANLAGHVSFYSVTLMQGETYQIASLNGAAGDMNDVTGTRVSATAPVAVFAGDSIALVPDGNVQAGNPLVQEQLPVEQWGTNIVAMAFAGRQNGDTYRIVAAYSNTVITITGAVITVVDEPYGGPWTVTSSNETVTITNQAGQFSDLILDGPVWFQATKPIQVAQFANGAWSDDATNTQSVAHEGDPCEILFSPASHWLETSIVVTPLNDNFNGDFDENFLNLITPSSVTNGIYMDGSLISATNFVAIGTSGYYAVQIALTNSGAHKLTSAQPLGVEVYGFGEYDSYSYFGGLVK